MGANAAHLEDGEHGEGGFVEAVGELVGVPAVAGVAAVGVDGAEEAHGGGGFQGHGLDLEGSLEAPSPGVVADHGEEAGEDRLNGVSSIFLYQGFWSIVILLSLSL